MSEAMRLVVPCFNEAARLHVEAFRTALATYPDLSFSFVDDGSTDDTRAVLEGIAAAEPGRVNIVGLPANAGKGEAVRRGLLAAFDDGATIAGYLDADLATSIVEMMRLGGVLASRDVDVVLGSRVSMLGRDIDRSRLRHYLGRLFASAASILLDLAVYDTQCGAKIFRRTAALVAGLRDPFLSRWAFDVELLGRLVIGAPGVPGLHPSRILEEPLEAWRDVRGSKVALPHMARTSLDLVRIGADLTTRRRRLRST
jgi:dolichyl-phosphate beta-glucosyltransferase